MKPERQRDCHDDCDDQNDKYNIHHRSINAVGRFYDSRATAKVIGVPLKKLAMHNVDVGPFLIHPTTGAKRYRNGLSTPARP